VQLAVQSKAHLDIIFFRADVDVAGPFADALRKYRIHQPDNRCFFGHALQRADLDIVKRGGFIGAFVDLHLFHVFEHAPDAGESPVNGGQQLVEMLFGANDRFNFAVGVHFDGVQRIDVERVGHGDGQQKTALSQRGRLHLVSDFCRQQLRQLDINGKAVRPVFFKLELTGDQVDNLRLADDAFADQKLAQFQVALFLVGQRLFELLLCEQPAFNQDLT
jgi:hypothetical protein